MRNVDNPTLIVNRLCVTGHRKNYIIPFKSGINIIYGDSDTGKSSILNLIDYCLGAKQVNLYDEIQLAGKEAFLEVVLTGEVYTIQRDIFDTKANIKVYKAPFADITEYFPLEYGPNYSKNGPNGFFSDFILEALQLPVVKVKESPSKVDSDFTTLSFRDLMKYMYLTQNAVGNQELLSHGSGAYVIATKNIQTFKYIFNLLDTQITNLEQQISTNSSKKGKLSEKSSTVAAFLRETNFETVDSIMGRMSVIDKEKRLLTSEIEKIDTNLISNSTLYNDIRKEISRLEGFSTEIREKIRIVNGKIDKYIRLKNEYTADIQKLKFSLEVSIVVPKPKRISCPLCHHDLIDTVDSSYQQHDCDKVAHEVSAIEFRLKQLINIIDELRLEEIALSQNLDATNQKLSSAQRLLDAKTSQFVSPYLTQREALISQRSSLVEELARLHYFQKVRNQQRLISDNIEEITKFLKKLNDEYAKLKLTLPSQDQIVNGIADILNDYLREIPIKNRYGVSIDSKSFLPIVRDRIYTTLTSGGLRTIVSIGYYLSLLKYGMDNSSNLPSFLMIDTAGKYLRKTSDKYTKGTDTAADAQEGTSDPHKIENLFTYMMNLAVAFEKDNIPMQIIIVDNDIPSKLGNKLKKYICARYSTTGLNGLPVGFIDDAYSHE